MAADQTRIPPAAPRLKLDAILAEPIDGQFKAFPAPVPLDAAGPDRLGRRTRVERAGTPVLDPGHGSQGPRAAAQHRPDGQPTAWRTG